MAMDARDSARARALLQQLIDKYPKSEERQVAEELLKNIKP
jgi:TolA-binding protein